MDRRSLIKRTGIAGVLAAGVAPAVHAQAAVRWRLASSFPKSLDTIFGSAAKFSETVKALSSGKFEVSVHPAGELMPAFGVVDALEKDTIEMAQTAAYYFAGKDPLFSMSCAVPFGLTTLQTAAWKDHGNGRKLLNAFFAKYNFQTLSGGNTTTQMGGWYRKPIKTAADLKGKKIVTGRGSIGHYLAIKALNDAGLTTQDVQFIFLLPAESRLVLDNGTADAWATWDPYTTVVTSQSNARVLVSGKHLLSNHLYFAATGQAIADKRVQLDDFVARIDRAYAWANTHPEQYAAAQAKITGLPLAVHIEVAQDTHLSPVTIDDTVIHGLQATADTYVKEGLLSKHIDVSQGFDSSFNAKRIPLEQASR